MDRAGLKMDCAPQKCSPVGRRRTRSTRLPVVSASYQVLPETDCLSTYWRHCDPILVMQAASTDFASTIAPAAS